LRSGNVERNRRREHEDPGNRQAHPSGHASG
jgi:hypothetical protein